MSVHVHPQGICESKSVGEGTHIWAFAHVLPGARVGADCNICDHVFIENDVVIGDRVTIKCGVQLWDGLRVEDDVFIGPNVTFSNDPFPRSKAHLPEVPQTHIALGASIGANSTVLPGVKIGRRAMVGAGCVVTRDVPPFAVVRGNPARIVGYTDSKQPEPGATAQASAASGPREIKETSIDRATLHRFHNVHDLRGNLAVGDMEKDVPFKVQRFFIVHEVPSRHIRGEHAHKQCKQFLVAASGSLRIMLDDGTRREEFILDSPTLGLYVPEMVWASQYHFSDDAALLVFASLPYDPSDYIRDYEAFLGARRA